MTITNDVVEQAKNEFGSASVEEQREAVGNAFALANAFIDHFGVIDKVPARFDIEGVEDSDLFEVGSKAADAVYAYVDAFDADEAFIAKLGNENPTLLFLLLDALSAGVGL